MSEPLRGYHFSSEAHWKTCLFVQMDHRSDGTTGPHAAYGQPPERFASAGAYAPIVTQLGDVLWRDNAERLHRITSCDEGPVSSRGPDAIACSCRLIATRSGIWTIGSAPNTIVRYEEDTMVRLLEVAVSSGEVVDITSDGDDAVVALAKGVDGWQATWIDRAGHVRKTITFAKVAGVVAFVFLPAARRFVLLVTKPAPTLVWFSDAGGASLFRVAIGALRPCFELGETCTTSIGTDGTDRVFVAGHDAEPGGSGEHIVYLDASGNRLGDVPIDSRDAPLTGVVGTRDHLLATGPRGLLRFSEAGIVPDGASVSGTFVTPVLFSPDREDQRRWLRAELSAVLPPGTTIDVAVAAVKDKATRDRLSAIAADTAVPSAQRLRRLFDEPDVWQSRIQFHGDEGHVEDGGTPFAAKLFDVSTPSVMVAVTLTAVGGARLPQLSRLSVLYPGQTLMANLPGIYQRREAEPGNFLRTLVGVLETTTQGLDASIGAMGSRIHPSTAAGPWLNFIARWLGLPWDDGLVLSQKRAIVTRAAELAGTRGTRAGLETLLECLMPGSPRRFRVVDATADYGFATVGGGSCTGSKLPAMLGGYTRWTAELDSQAAVLGRMRLPCDSQRDDGAWQLAGQIRVDVAASARERQNWEPWLAALIGDMVPLTARVDLRWVSVLAFETDRLDGTLTLRPDPSPHLGTDAVTGRARLPELRTRTSASGPAMGTRLR